MSEYKADEACVNCGAAYSEHEVRFGGDVCPDGLDTFEHAHRWEPIEGLMARYRCECGVTGYRNRLGRIVQHVKQAAYRDEPRPRPTVGTGEPNLIGGNRWVPAKRGAS